MRSPLITCFLGMATPGPAASRKRSGRYASGTAAANVAAQRRGLFALTVRVKRRRLHRSKEDAAYHPHLHQASAAQPCGTLGWSFCSRLTAIHADTGDAW